MREALKLKPLCTSYLFNAALLGAVLALIALLPTVANAQAGPPEQVTICHQPGMPAEQTLTIPSTALNGHLGHGDTEGPCCPCAASGSAMELNELFLRQEFDGAPATDYCAADRGDTTVVRVDSPSFTDPLLIVGVGNQVGGDEFLCNYYLTDGEGQIILDVVQRDLQPREVESCREDIRKLIAELDDCPTP